MAEWDSDRLLARHQVRVQIGQILERWAIAG
jgi:hypothetical protein